MQVALTGFTTILGVTFDESGRLYVLENSTVAGMGPTPGTGDIIRIDLSGKDRDTCLQSFFTHRTYFWSRPQIGMFPNMGFGRGQAEVDKYYRLTWGIAYHHLRC